MVSSSLPIGRLAVQVVSTVGVSKVVNDIIANNTNVLTTFDAIKVWTGSIVIGAVIVETTSNYVDAKMIQLATWNEARKAEKEEPTTA
jgi:energy-converting hydrogenase Eha subunit E